MGDGEGVAMKTIKRLVRHFIDAAGEESRHATHNHFVGARLDNGVAVVATVIDRVSGIHRHLCQMAVPTKRRGSERRDTGRDEDLAEVARMETMMPYLLHFPGEVNMLQGTAKRECPVVNQFDGGGQRDGL